MLIHSCRAHCITTVLTSYVYVWVPQNTPIWLTNFRLFNRFTVHKNELIKNMLFNPCGGKKTDEWPQCTVAAYGPTVPAPDGQ